MWVVLKGNQSPFCGFCLRQTQICLSQKHHFLDQLFLYLGLAEMFQDIVFRSPESGWGSRLKTLTFEGCWLKPKADFRYVSIGGFGQPWLQSLTLEREPVLVDPDHLKSGPFSWCPLREGGTAKETHLGVRSISLARNASNIGGLAGKPVVSRPQSSLESAPKSRG